jgi:hypothetical protein
MIARPQGESSRIEDVARQIRFYCRCLTEYPPEDQNAFLALDRIRQLLDFVPMASDDFDDAILRVNNARRYLQSREPGAARYEIHLLLGVFAHHPGADGEDAVWIRPPTTDKSAGKKVSWIPWLLQLFKAA